MLYRRIFDYLIDNASSDAEKRLLNTLKKHCETSDTLRIWTSLLLDTTVRSSAGFCSSVQTFVFILNFNSA